MMRHEVSLAGGRLRKNKGYNFHKIYSLAIKLVKVSMLVKGFYAFRRLFLHL